MERKRFFSLRGFMKSGTNWLGGLLNSHPDICCLGEFHWQEIMQPAYLRLKNETLYGDEAFKRLTIRELEQAIRRLMRRVADPVATVIGERTPTTLAPIVFRDGPCVTMTRDGRDALVSRAFHLYNNPQVTRMFSRHPQMREHLAAFREDPWYFRDHPDRLLDNEELVRVSARWWKQHLQRDRRTMASHRRLRVKVVRYEELHRDCQGVMSGVFEFLEVDPLKAPSPEGDLQAGFGEERPHSFFRKGKVGDWQIYFTPQAKEWFELEAGDELVLQGYATGKDW
ncbi:MAG TPA: sulfotransferase domain-containing protein [Pirellulaceae bacterium]|nr:sulfotransferase domain-containing protein [Pirellulaceae bacterium]